MSAGDSARMLALISRLTQRIERVEKAVPDNLPEIIEQVLAALEQARQDGGDGDGESGGEPEDGGDEKKPKRPTPIWWPALSDDDHARLRQELRRWCRDVLAARYPYDAAKLTVCWERHPEVVDLVTAAWVGWAIALIMKGADNRDAMDWHLRWRPDLLEAASELLRACRDNRRHDPPEGLDPVLLGSFDPDAPVRDWPEPVDLHAVP